jgi:hypothetical protein
MAVLNQTLTLNTDLFPLGAAINKTFQKAVTINGNATIFGTVSFDPQLAPAAIEQIALNDIDDRAFVFLQADSSNGLNKIQVGLLTVSSGDFDGLIELAAGEIAIFPFKYNPNAIPATMPKLAATLTSPTTGSTEVKLHFSVLETL